MSEFIAARKPERENWQILHKSLTDICQALEDLDFNPNVQQQGSIFELLQSNCETIFVKEISKRTDNGDQGEM